MGTHFGNGDGLLFHGLVDGHPVVFSHLGRGKERGGRKGRGGGEEGRREGGKGRREG